MNRCSTSSTSGSSAYTSPSSPPAHLGDAGLLPRLAALGDDADSLTAINDEVLAVVGEGDELELGLHIGARLEHARELFIADGFEVIEPGAPNVAWPSVLRG